MPTSKMCSVTGEIAVNELPLNVREWECLKCGQIHDRDINVAINIRDTALKILDEMGIQLEKLQKVSGYVRIETKFTKVPIPEGEKIHKGYRIAAYGNRNGSIGKTMTIFGYKNNRLIFEENRYYLS